ELWPDRDMLEIRAVPLDDAALPADVHLEVAVRLAWIDGERAGDRLVLVLVLVGRRHRRRDAAGQLARHRADELHAAAVRARPWRAAGRAHRHHAVGAGAVYA